MKYSDYKIHPFADHLPLLSDQEMSDLAADIKANGQRLPIIRCNGFIIDGRNMYEPETLVRMGFTYVAVGRRGRCKK